MNSQIQKFDKDENLHSEDTDYQERQLYKLQEKQEKLLHLKKVLEELKSSLSDSLNLAPALNEDVSCQLLCKSLSL